MSEQKITEALQKSWYSEEEIAKVLQSYKEKQQGLYFSSEDVMKSLLQKEASYA